jgi:C4-dicarboxylate transporter DctM subunit
VQGTECKECTPPLLKYCIKNNLIKAPNRGEVYNMDAVTVGIIGLIIMIYFIFTGMNIGMTFLVVGVAGFAILSSPAGAIALLKTTFYTTASNYTFAVIPLFILMGEFCFRSGISSDLYDMGNKWLNRLPGSMACGSIAASAFFGAICGSLAATTATMGTIGVPEMRKAGYDPKIACGSIAAGGTLGILIPPSTTFIIYGIAAEASIGRLFASGIFPGIICAGLMIITVVIWCKLKPGVAPANRSYSWKERFKSLRGLLDVAILFLFVFGGMFGGVFTVNEAAGAGAFLAGILMILRRRMTLMNLKLALLSTAKSFSMVYLCIMGANVMGNFIAVSKIPNTLAAYVAGLDVSKYTVLAIIILIYLFLGCIMDGLAVILLTVPIFLPVMMDLGFDLIWFGTIIILTSQLGGITPPVGISCYALSGVVKDVPLQTIFKGIFPFLIPLLLTIVIITIFPQIAIWLPNVLYGT